MEFLLFSYFFTRVQCFFFLLTFVANFTLTTETGPISVTMDNNQNGNHVNYNGTYLPNCTTLLSQVHNFDTYSLQGGGVTRWRNWLRHCATSRKVACSIPDGVVGIFHWHNPSGRSKALGLTQPLIEMSAKNIYWGKKAAGAKGCQPSHVHVSIVLKFGSLSLLEPSGHVQACNGIALPSQPSEPQIPHTAYFTGALKYQKQFRPKDTVLWHPEAELCYFEITSPNYTLTKFRIGF